MARDGAGATTTLAACCPTFPAFESEETPGIGFSESPGMGDGAKGVEGEGTTKGELADCKGVPVLVRDGGRFCWSTCGEECCKT